MKITDRAVRGRPSEKISALSRRVSRYVQSSQAVKVGMTSNPERRAGAYGDEYNHMVLIYKTASERNARLVERELVKIHWSHLDNEGPGGVGPLGDPPYYVYLVRER